MPKKADTEKEAKFIEAYTSGNTIANATQSAIKAGYKKSPKQWGNHLKDKFKDEIRKAHESNLAEASGVAINELTSLLKDESSRIRLDACKHVLDVNNFTSQTINLNVEKSPESLDRDALIDKITSLAEKVPHLKDKILQNSKQDTKH